MIPVSLHHKGTVAFPDEIAIDFTELGNLIGVQGPNGSGKTTFFDLMIGALYLVFPYRPTALTRQFVSQGFINFVWEFGGKCYRSDIKVDPETERTEATLYPGEGGGALAGPNQRDYKRKIEEILGSLSLYLCTAYSVQQSETSKTRATSFIRSDRSERRAVLAAMLRLDAYPKREEAAKKQIAAQDTALTTNRTRIADLTPRAHDLPVLEAQQTSLDQRVHDAAGRQGEITTGIAALRESLSAKTTARAELEPLLVADRELSTEITTLDARIVEINRRRKNNADVLDRDAEIRAAVERHDVLTMEIATLQAQQSEKTRVTQELAQVRQQLDTAATGLGEVDLRLSGIRALLDSANKIRTAATTSQELTDQLADIQRRIDETQAAYRTALVVFQEGKTGRLALTHAQTTRAGLDRDAAIIATVPCRGEGEFAGCQFLVNAAAAKASIPASDVEIAALIAQIATAPATEPPDSSTALVTERGVITGQLKALAPTAGRLAALETAQERLDDLQGQQVSVSGQITALERRRDDLTTRLTTLAGQGERITALEQEAGRVAKLVALEPKLLSAQGRIEELDGHLALAEQDLEARQGSQRALKERLETIPDLDKTIDSITKQLADAERLQKSAQDALGALEREAGELSARVAASIAARDELATVMAATAPITETIADYALLAKAFSPPGIPALKIDLALPEIGRVATELLRECFGESLFMIQLTTQKESADGDKLLETLDILVSRDAETVDAAVLSGGEAVLVSEALSLSLALYNATRSGKKIQTLFRDEVGAPLDPVRAPAYVQMLRRAIKLGDFRHIFFVSHQPTCIALADTPPTMGEGTIRVS